MTDEDERIERMARSIHAKLTSLNGWVEVPWEDLSDISKDIWLDAARAAEKARGR